MKKLYYVVNIFSSLLIISTPITANAITVASYSSDLTSQNLTNENVSGISMYYRLIFEDGITRREAIDGAPSHVMTNENIDMFDLSGIGNVETTLNQPNEFINVYENQSVISAIAYITGQNESSIKLMPVDNYIEASLWQLISEVVNKSLSASEANNLYKASIRPSLVDAGASSESLDQIDRIFNLEDSSTLEMLFHQSESQLITLFGTSDSKKLANLNPELTFKIDNEYLSQPLKNVLYINDNGMNLLNGNSLFGPLPIAFGVEAGYANVTYIDDTTGNELKNQSLQGNIGEVSNYSTTDIVKFYEEKGYELVSDDFPTNGIIFTTNAQHYSVHLQHKLTTVNPSNPGKPGILINPTNSEGPKWPNGTDKNSLTKTITETIHYVYENGSKVADDITDSSTFNHEVVVDNVTGKIVKDNGWTNADKDYFSQKDSPAINGYTASKVSVNKVEGLTQDSNNVEETVVYVKNLVTPVDTTYPTNPGLPGTNGGTGISTGTGLTQVVNNQRTKDSLPNTGTDEFGKLSILGALITAVGVAGYVFFGHKKKNQKLEK